MNYYNEFDPKAAAWLRELIKQKHIPEGVVDERSITEVKPEELAGYQQCHFFAGIGGWAYALRLAGVPDEMELWTGSCPCQPFSVAGRGRGVEDERHLWPAFFKLIEARKPKLVFGEQVAKKDGLAWLDLVFDDLEGGGYTCGAAVMAACGAGAPHIRERLYWMAHTSGIGRRGGREEAGGLGTISEAETAGSGSTCWMANADGEGLEGHSGSTIHRSPQHPDENSGNHKSFWTDSDWLYCRGGVARPVEPELKPMATGVSGRVGLLRGYGNAIVPQVAAQFIIAALGAEEENE